MHTLTDCATRTDRREHTVQILRQTVQTDRQADKPCRKTDRQTDRQTNTEWTARQTEKNMAGAGRRGQD